MIKFICGMIVGSAITIVLGILCIAWMIRDEG
jgi:hypothetical protein